MLDLACKTLQPCMLDVLCFIAVVIGVLLVLLVDIMEWNFVCNRPKTVMSEIITFIFLQLLMSLQCFHAVHIISYIKFGNINL